MFSFLLFVLQVHSHSVLQQTLQLLLSISAILVKNVEAADICQVCLWADYHPLNTKRTRVDRCRVLQALTCVDALMSEKCPDQLLLAALEFLSSLGKIFIPPQTQVVKRICPFVVGLSSSPVKRCVSVRVRSCRGSVTCLEPC